MSALIIFFYAFATILQLCIGVANVMAFDSPHNPGDKKQRRLGARMALTCWAWPIWATIGIYRGARYLINEAI